MRKLLASTLAALACAALAGPAGAGDDARLLVKFRPGTEAAGRTHALAAARAARDGGIPALGVVVVSAPGGQAREALAELRSSPDVLYAERDGTLTIDRVPDDPYSGASFWQHALPRFPAAWDLTIGRRHAVVAVLDTGVAPAHPDLGELVAGYDFVNGDAAPDDDHGHGTAVAGVAAARANNGRGVAGACWRCRVMPVKVLDASGSGYWSTVAAGIVWAADHGADVVNLSLGGASGSSTVASAVAYARERGVVVVASAGNAGNEKLTYPAAYEGVVAVAASNESDRLYAFSTRGDWVEVAAPGCTTTTMRGGGYGSFCGTSAAAPFVAGLAGLALSFAPSATERDLRAAIVRSASPTLAGVAHGRIDARAALERLAPLAAVPANLRRPRVRGEKAVGALVRARPGRWAGPVLGYRYRWQRCGPKGCVRVARGASYRVRPADGGRRLRLVVVARAESAGQRARSRPTRLVR